MNRLLLLILVAGLTFLIVLFALKPELIESIWLWIIGLAGALIKAFKLLINFIKEKFRNQTENQLLSSESKNADQGHPMDKDDFKGITLKLLRYHDDGQTTTGLLLINDTFYCFSLEDTFNEVKIEGETRIPAGTYPIELRETETELTTTYRERYPLWFVWHLWLKDVPGFSAVYIHNGGDHTHTEGCLLVSDSLNANNTKSFLSNSKETFHRLYVYLFGELRKGVKVRINISDESKLLT